VKAVLGLLGSLTVALGVAFDPRFADTTLFWVLLGIPLILAGAFALNQLRRAGALGPLLRFRGGDLTLGAGVAILLLLATWFGRTQFAALRSPSQLWLFRLYLQLGDPNRLQSSLLLTVLLAAIVVAQEVIFRGYVQEVFEERWGARWGWITAALAYAFVASPTLWTLRAEGVGLNPLLFLAALLGGLALGFVRRVSGRLPPVLVAQGVFTYFSVLQFRLPGL